MRDRLFYHHHDAERWSGHRRGCWHASRAFTVNPPSIITYWVRDTSSSAYHLERSLNYPGFGQPAAMNATLKLPLMCSFRTLYSRVAPLTFKNSYNLIPKEHQRERSAGVYEVSDFA